METSHILKKESHVMISYPQVGVRTAGMAEYVKLATNELVDSEVQKVTIVGDDLDMGEIRDSEFIRINQVRGLSWNIAMSLAILFGGYLFGYPLNIFLRKAKGHDCIYVPHSFFGVSVFLTLLLNKTKASKIVWTLHDPVRHEERKSMLFLFLKKIEYRQIVRLCSRYKNRLFIHIHSDRLVSDTIWQGLDNLVCWQHPLPERMVFETPYEDEIVIGFAGRIEPYKGLDMMLSAIAHVQNSFEKKIKVLVLGRGDYDNELVNLIKEPCEVHNRFLEKIELHKGVARMDCVVLPYLTATQSGIGFLALKYEKPIIATDVGALSEIIELSENPASSLCLPTVDSLGQALVKFVNNFQK